MIDLPPRSQTPRTESSASIPLTLHPAYPELPDHDHELPDANQLLSPCPVRFITVPSRTIVCIMHVCTTSCIDETDEGHLLEVNEIW